MLLPRSLQDERGPPLLDRLAHEDAQVVVDSILSILESLGLACVVVPLSSLEVHGEKLRRSENMMPEINFLLWIFMLEQPASAPPSPMPSSAFSTGNSGFP